MRIDKNYQYLLRCIDRFRKLLLSDKPKVFVLLSRDTLVGDQEFSSLHVTLSRYTPNFGLFFVIVGRPRDDIHDFGFDLIKTVGQSHLLAMRPVSQAGPLTFDDPLDDFMFRRAIASFAGATRTPRLSTFEAATNN